MPEAPAAAPPWPAPATAWYATAVLLLAYTFSFVDRQVLNLLVEPIRTDLGLSDTQISLLQGLGFVATYVLLSVPAGRLVDRHSRIAVLIGGMLVWSASTFACGLATSFALLLIARLGVGAGEATVTPAAWSLLPDLFPPERLARAVSVFLIGPYLGAGIALIAGAEVIAWTRTVDAVSLPVIGELAAWQVTFIAAALPGVPIALLLATVAQPRRHAPRGRPAQAPAWPEVLAQLRRHARIYAALLCGIPFLVLILYGLQSWVPTILVRVHGWDIVQAGRVYGTIALISGSAGVLTGPLLARHMARHGWQDHPLRLAAWSALAIMASLATLPWQRGTGALACIAAAGYFVTLPLAMVTWALQRVTPASLRGTIAGLYVVATNGIGLALGPTLIATATERVFGDPRAVDSALVLVCLLVAPLAALLLWSGMRAWREFERAGALATAGNR